jgi:ribosomal protein S18 acetylase RimI-like enzyme
LGELTFRPLTKNEWPALEALFGKSGACAGCWCMYWRLAKGEWKGPQRERSARNKVKFQRLVESGPVTGLLAFDGDTAVGWVAIQPRTSFPALDRSRLLKPVDDESVWSMPCFYIKSGHRGRGVMRALVEAALDYAAEAGARLIEAYPVDTEQRLSAANAYTGVASSFRRAGFKTVARRAAHRPIVRKALKSKALKSKVPRKT